MTIEVTDKLEEKRKDMDRAKAFARALEEGNQAMAECFAELARIAKEAALDGDLYEVKEALECIETLSDIGYSSDQ